MDSDTPFQTILEPSTCVKKGLCTVAQHPLRRLYYEVHGSVRGSQKMLLIIGLNFSCAAWSFQVDHFGKKPDHAVLVIDNRGVGNSDCGALERYKTSEMAQDTLQLLNTLGWDQDRSLHIFGVSLGGMISQELCLLVPKRIRSVSFISTSCGEVFDFPSFKALHMFVRSISRSVTRDQGMNLILGLLFPKAYLDRRTESDRTRRDELKDHLYTWYNNPRRQSPKGLFGQVAAVTSHCRSKRDLRHLVQELGPAKILVATGDQDELIIPVRSLELHQHLPGAELVVFNGIGHALQVQATEEFNALMERVMDEGNRTFDQEKEN